MAHYSLTATEATARFANGSLTVEEYARSLLSRIVERDPAVRAWAYIDPEFVMEQAKNLDRVPVDNRGPLHGVAIAVKDIIYTKRRFKITLSIFYRDLSVNEANRYADTA
jgi:amidase